MYYMAVQSGISVADYYAFDTAYGMIVRRSCPGRDGPFGGQIKLILAIVKPFFEHSPRSPTASRC